MSSTRREFIRRAGLWSALTTLGTTGAEAFDYSGDALHERTRRLLSIPPDRIYLNTGSLGPSPSIVMDAVVSAMRQLETDPVSENWGRLGEQMELARKKVAAFVHAKPDEVLLTRNTTEGLNLIGQTLTLQAGDEIITTTLEHGGAEVGLEYLVQMRGAILKRVDLPLPPGDEAEILRRIERALTPRTRLILLSHVNTITGLVMPLKKVDDLRKGKDIVLVADGAQAAGMLPLDMGALGVDVYASSGHKWLLGPKETGFVYLSPAIQQKVKPLFSFSGFEAYTRASGTRNVALAIGLGAAIDFHQSLGPENVVAYNATLRRYCQQKLSEVPGITVISPPTESLSSAMVSFSVEKLKNNQVYEALKTKGIIVKVLTAHNAIRISCHMFVSSQDIDKFIEALRPIVS